MRFTTKTEYGLFCLIYMAKNNADTIPITVKDIVKGERYSITYAEKILQTLRLANIVSSHQGNRGGYLLAREASEITLREIIEALEGNTFDVFCDEPRTRKEIVCNHFPLCHVKPVWERTKQILDHFYGSITLEMLAKNQLDFSKTSSLIKQEKETVLSKEKHGK